MDRDKGVIAGRIAGNRAVLNENCHETGAKFGTTDPDLCAKDIVKDESRVKRRSVFQLLAGCLLDVSETAMRAWPCGKTLCLVSTMPPNSIALASNQSLGEWVSHLTWGTSGGECRE